MKHKYTTLTRSMNPFSLKMGLLLPQGSSFPKTVVKVFGTIFEVDPRLARGQLGFRNHLKAIKYKIYWIQPKKRLQNNILYIIFHVRVCF